MEQLDSSVEESSRVSQQHAIEKRGAAVSKVFALLGAVADLVQFNGAYMVSLNIDDDATRCCHCHDLFFDPSTFFHPPTL